MVYFIKSKLECLCILHTKLPVVQPTRIGMRTVSTNLIPSQPMRKTLQKVLRMWNLQAAERRAGEPQPSPEALDEARIMNPNGPLLFIPSHIRN